MVYCRNRYLRSSLRLGASFRRRLPCQDIEALAELAESQSQSQANPSGRIQQPQKHLAEVCPRPITRSANWLNLQVCLLQTKPLPVNTTSTKRNVLPTVLLSTAPLPPMGFPREARHLLLYHRRLPRARYYGCRTANQEETWRWAQRTDTIDLSE